MKQIILLTIGILFKCAASNSNIQSLYIYYNCSQALLHILYAPDVDIRLITKTLLSSLFKSGDILHGDCVLQDDEMLRLVAVLSTKSITSQCLSFQALPHVMMHLVKNIENASLFLKYGIPALLDPLSDQLIGEEEQKILAKLVWQLMQYEHEGALIDPDPTELKDVAQETLGMYICMY